MMMNKVVPSTKYRMPAEWEPHAATWIAWPHEKGDWLAKFHAIDWVYTEIVRVIGNSEPVEIICHNEEIRSHALKCLKQTQVPSNKYRLHLVPNNRSWLRDSLPTGVVNDKDQHEWIKWNFNAWAKYDNFALDQQVPDAVGKISGYSLINAKRPDNGAPFVLEGGAIDTDGEGSLLVSEECLLSHIQERNPSMSREVYEEALQLYLGIKKVLWLGDGIAGDDTHGHIDDIARFTAPAQVVLAYEEQSSDINYRALCENYERLEGVSDAKGRRLELIKLPMPQAIIFDGERLPASYLNFYIANDVVIIPTFNDENDYRAIGILSELFPSRKVIGIHAVDLVMGQGTLHCLTQQQISNLVRFSNA